MQALPPISSKSDSILFVGIPKELLLWVIELIFRDCGHKGLVQFSLTCKSADSILKQFFMDRKVAWENALSTFLEKKSETVFRSLVCSPTDSPIKSSLIPTVNGAFYFFLGNRRHYGDFSIYTPHASELLSTHLIEQYHGKKIYQKGSAEFFLPLNQGVCVIVGENIFYKSSKAQELKKITESCSTHSCVAIDHFPSVKRVSYVDYQGVLGSKVFYLFRHEAFFFTCIEVDFAQDEPEVKQSKSLLDFIIRDVFLRIQFEGDRIFGLTSNKIIEAKLIQDECIVCNEYSIENTTMGIFRFIKNNDSFLVIWYLEHLEIHNKENKTKWVYHLNDFLEGSAYLSGDYLYCFQYNFLCIIDLRNKMDYRYLHPERCNIEYAEFKFETKETLVLELCIKTDDFQLEYLKINGGSSLEVRHYQ